jgi:hypothetical protein
LHRKLPFGAFYRQDHMEEKKDMVIKTLLIMLVFAVAGCMADTRDDPVPCGYDQLPHEHEPISCGANPWTYEGDCCTWVTEEFYSECVTSWCYNEYVCGWMINQRSCRPI